MSIVRFNNPPFSDDHNAPSFGEPIPSTPSEGGSQMPFSGGPLDASDGYVQNGPNTPQDGSGSGAEDTWIPGVQTGEDAGGLVQDLDSYTQNAICLPEGALEDYEAAWSAGRAQAAEQGIDQQNRAALDYRTQYGFGVDPVEHAILEHMYAIGLEGTGTNADEGYGEE